MLGPRYVLHTRRWAEHAAKAGFRVELAGEVRPGRQAFDFTGIAERVHDAPIPRGVPLGSMEPIIWLRRLVGRVSPDLVHAHWAVSWPFWAAVARCRPLVVSVWGSDIYFPRGLPRLKATFAIRRADQVTGPSPALVDELMRRGADRSRATLVDHGVDLGLFSPVGPEQREAARRRLGLKGGPWVLSFRGGTPVYNLDTVIAAFSRLRRSMPRARLLLVHGSVPLSEAASRAIAAADLGNAIRVEGAVEHDRMPDYFRAATVGISVPSSDGSPISVWESMACGLPVILSDLPQLRERLEGTGAARFVAIEDGAIAEALRELLEHPGRLQGMSRKGRRWAVENVDHLKGRERLTEVYERALQGRARPSRAGAAPGCSAGSR
jgi:glycosyltransferase involved in cell wall biosynthesis